MIRAAEAYDFTRSSIVITSIWGMNDMKATLLCDAHISRSVHRGLAYLMTHFAITRLDPVPKSGDQSFSTHVALNDVR